MSDPDETAVYNILLSILDGLAEQEHSQPERMALRLHRLIRLYRASLLVLGSLDLAGPETMRMTMDYPEMLRGLIPRALRFVREEEISH